MPPALVSPTAVNHAWTPSLPKIMTFQYKSEIGSFMRNLTILRGWQLSPYYLNTIKGRQNPSRERKITPMSMHLVHSDASAFT